MKKPLLIASGLALSTLALWFLPGTVDSYLVFGVILCMFLGSVVLGIVRNQWLPAILMGTYILMTDLFGFSQLHPDYEWLAIAALWIGGTWLIGYIGGKPTHIFHQGLASFLVIEVFFILLLWPLNIISKSVIAVSFAFFLWNEFVRTASTRQRVTESVVPFFLIVILMSLTGRWFTF